MPWDTAAPLSCCQSVGSRPPRNCVFITAPLCSDYTTEADDLLSPPNRVFGDSFRGKATVLAKQVLLYWPESGNTPAQMVFSKSSVIEAWLPTCQFSANPLHLWHVVLGCTGSGQLRSSGSHVPSPGGGVDIRRALYPLRSRSEAFEDPRST